MVVLLIVTEPIPVPLTWMPPATPVLLATRQPVRVVVESLVSSAPATGASAPVPPLLVIDTRVKVAVPPGVAAAGPPVFPTTDPPVMFKVPKLLKTPAPMPALLG